jgi:hypothetical protein
MLFPPSMTVYSELTSQLAQEYDIFDIIGEGVFGDEWKQSQILLEINDIATLDENQLVALVGYTDSQSASSSAGRQHRSYGVAVMDVTGKTLGVTKFIDLAYSSVSTDIRCPAVLTSRTREAERFILVC